MKNQSLKYYKNLLIALISSLSITGIGFIDDKFWSLIFICIGMFAYMIVGVLYSAKILRGRQEGRDAYVVVFVILIIIGFYLYQGILNIHQWLLSLPIQVKIIIPATLGALIILVSVIIYLKNKKLNKEIK